MIFLPRPAALTAGELSVSTAMNLFSDAEGGWVRCRGVAGGLLSLHVCAWRGGFASAFNETK